VDALVVGRFALFTYRWARFAPIGGFALVAVGALLAGVGADSDAFDAYLDASVRIRTLW